VVAFIAPYLIFSNKRADGNSFPGKQRLAIILEHVAETLVTEPSTEVVSTPNASEAVQTRATVNAEIRSIARIAGRDQAWVEVDLAGKFEGVCRLPQQRT
jgi:hypothetical protein